MTGSVTQLTAPIAALVIPLAHAGHVLADAAIFGVPVGMVVGTILVLRKWGPRDE
jgi:hypothetical protein